MEDEATTSTHISPDVVEQALTVPVQQPAPVIEVPTDPTVALQARMLKLLDTMEARMATLEAENKVLRSQAEQALVDETPNHLKAERRNIAPGEDRFARRVVVATAAADPEWVDREIPQARGRIVDAGGLVQNTLEKIMSGGDREDA